MWLFILAGALTVTLTFVVIAAFARGGVERYAAAQWHVPRSFVNGWAIAALKLAGVAALVLVLAAGLLGNQDPNRNIAPTLVWIVWWVGFSYVAMLLGNLWPAVNPWRTLHDLFSRSGTPSRRWPARLGAWPAVAGLLAFGWFELVFPFRATPWVLAVLVLAYGALTWTGMARYGAQAWLEHADPFHRLFALFSRFAPFALAPNGDLVLRPHGAGLLSRDEPLPTAHMAFILAMLAIVLFDGFQASAYWVTIENAVHALNPQLGDAGWIALHSVALLVMWLVFLGLYLTACRLAEVVSRNTLTTLDYARVFSPTLIPIAVGYHFAHTFTYLIVQGQGMAFLVSDPFGFGWNLFGTAAAVIDEAIVSTRTAWYLALSAIVLGHTISVWLAHAVAERLLPARGQALRALIPITLLMVLYTVISLQILAEPLVRYSGPQETII